MTDRILFWLVDCWDAFRAAWSAWWIADEETSRYCSRIDRELDLEEDIQTMLTGRNLWL